MAGPPPDRPDVADPMELLPYLDRLLRYVVGEEQPNTPNYVRATHKIEATRFELQARIAQRNLEATHVAAGVAAENLVAAQDAAKAAA